MQAIHYNMSEDPPGDGGERLAVGGPGEVLFGLRKGIGRREAGKGNRQKGGLPAHTLGILYISSGIKRSKVG